MPEVTWSTDDEATIVIDRDTYVLLRDHLLDCDKATLHGLWGFGEKLDSEYRPE